MIGSPRSRALLTLVLSGLSFALHYLHLADTPFANGWDGYFYLVQVKSWVEEGAMHSRDFSPIYLLMRGMYHLCGDHILAYKLTSALLAAVFTALSTLLGMRLGKSVGLGTLAGLWTLFSPSLQYFAGSFPKNLMGMDFLLLAMWMGMRQKPVKMWASVVLAAVTHRLTAALSALLLVFRHFNAKNVLVLLLLGVLGGAVLAFFPGAIHLADLQRFDGAFSMQANLPHWTFPKLMGGEDFPMLWHGEIYVGLGLVLLMAGRFWLGRLALEDRKWQRALLLLLLLLWFPFLKMEALGMGYRFFLAGMLLLPLVLATALSRSQLGIFLLPIGLALGIASNGNFDADRFGPPHAEYAQVSDRIVAFFGEKKPELLIGHKGLAEQVTFETGIDVLPWQPEYEVDSMELWRISTDIFPMDFATYLSPKDLSEVHSISLYRALIRESVWQRFVQAAKSAEDGELLGRIEDWVNPHEERPAYLLGK